MKNIQTFLQNFYKNIYLSLPSKLGSLSVSIGASVQDFKFDNSCNFTRQLEESLIKQMGTCTMHVKKFKQPKNKVKPNSTGASNRSFYPIFNKSFDHLEILLTICRPQKSFVSWVTVWAFSV